MHPDVRKTLLKNEYLQYKQGLTCVHVGTCWNCGDHDGHCLYGDVYRPLLPQMTASSPNLWRQQTGKLLGRDKNDAE
jgi:hypothetical protein